MRSRQLSALLFATFLALAGCAGPTSETAASEPAGDALTLAFGWPTDLAAVVDVKRLNVRDDGRTNPEHLVELRYRLRTEPYPGALRIVSEGVQVTSIDGRTSSGSSLDGVEGAEATVVALAPTLRVDADGTVLEVEGLEALRRQTAERIAAASPRARAQADRIAQLTITPEKLSEHWAAAVESWVGMEVELGASYEMEVNEARPGTLEVSERVPCFEGASDTLCVRLRLESWLDPDAGAAEFQSAARGVLAQLGGPELPLDALRSVELRETIDLVTEPERLIPHFVRVRRETRFEAEAAGEKRSLSRIDETQHRYRY